MTGDLTAYDHRREEQRKNTEGTTRYTGTRFLGIIHRCILLTGYGRGGFVVVGGKDLHACAMSDDPSSAHNPNGMLLYVRHYLSAS